MVQREMQIIVIFPKMFLKNMQVCMCLRFNGSIYKINDKPQINSIESLQLKNKSRETIESVTLSTD